MALWKESAKKPYKRRFLKVNKFCSFKFLSCLSPPNPLFDTNPPLNSLSNSVSDKIVVDSVDSPVEAAVHPVAVDNTVSVHAATLVVAVAVAVAANSLQVLVVAKEEMKWLVD